MPILVQDTFVGRTVASGWGTASDGNVWTQQITGAGAGSTSVASSEGKVTNLGACYFTLGSGTTVSPDALFRFSVSSATADAARAILRWQNSSNFYQLGFGTAGAAGQVVLRKTVAGATTDVSSSAFTVSAATFYWCRARASGSTLSAKIWASGSSEPNAWMLQATDTSIAVAGLAGLVLAGSAGTSNVDSFQLDALSSIWTVFIWQLDPWPAVAGAAATLQVASAGGMTGDGRGRLAAVAAGTQTYAIQAAGVSTSSGSAQLNFRYAILATGSSSSSGSGAVLIVRPACQLSRLGAQYALDVMTGRNTNPFLSSSRTTYLALLTAAPNDATTVATMAETTMTGYARKAVTWTTPSASSLPETHNFTQVNFGPLSGTMQVITHVALVSSASGTAGDFLVWGVLTAAVSPLSGQTLQVATGSFSLTV